MKTTTNINPIDRIQRIAMTGDIAEPKPLSPVENIMSHYPKVETQAQQPEEGGFWNGLKNFAGSKGGRMLIGGLGTGLAVGLTGGGLQNALGYGVIGAGKTAENIYNQEQDQKAWEEKEAERLFRQQENLDNRKFQAQMKMAEIEANKQARADEFEKIKEELRLKDQYGAFDKKGKTPAEQVEAFAKAGATPEAVSKFAESLGLEGYEFKDTTPKLTGQTQLLDYMVNILGVEPSEAISRIAKMTPSEQLALHQGKVAINTDGKLVIVDAQHQNEKELLGSKQAHDVNMAGVKFGYDSKLQSQKDIAKMRFEEFKNRLPTEQQRNIEAQAKALNIDPAVIYQTMKDKEDALIEKIIAESGRTEAQTDYTNAQTDFITGAKTDLTNAQTGLINARTGLTEAQTTKLSKEIENFGKTSAIWAAEWLANNPNATLEQKAAMGAVGNMTKEVAGFKALGMPEQEAFNLVTGLLKKQLAEANIWTDASSQTTGQVGGTAPVYPAEEDGEDPLNLMK